MRARFKSPIPMTFSSLRKAISDVYLADENRIVAERMAQARLTPDEARTTTKVGAPKSDSGYSTDVVQAGTRNPSLGSDPNDITYICQSTEIANATNVSSLTYRFLFIGY